MRQKIKFTKVEENLVGKIKIRWRYHASIRRMTRYKNSNLSNQSKVDKEVHFI